MAQVAGQTGSPPHEITLVYRPVGQSHVFTATGPKMKGFHISSPDLRVAFDLAPVALGKHVALIYGVPARYEIEHPFADFEAHLRESIPGNRIRAVIAGAEAVRAAC
jgi:hypothetical protein